MKEQYINLFECLEVPMSPPQLAKILMKVGVSYNNQDLSRGTEIVKALMKLYDYENEGIAPYGTREHLQHLRDSAIKRIEDMGFTLTRRLPNMPSVARGFVSNSDPEKRIVVLFYQCSRFNKYRRAAFNVSMLPRNEGRSNRYEDGTQEVDFFVLSLLEKGATMILTPQEAYGLASGRNKDSGYGSIWLSPEQVEEHAFEKKAASLLGKADSHSLVGR